MNSNCENESFKIFIIPIVTHSSTFSVALAYISISSVPSWTALRTVTHLEALWSLGPLSLSLSLSLSLLIHLTFNSWRTLPLDLSVGQ